MSKVMIFEGHTTGEAIEKGLKELKLTKNDVDIRVLDQEKRSFFDILAPRVVKVEITVKEKNNLNDISKIDENELLGIKEKLEEFLLQLLSKIDKDADCEIKIVDSELDVNINGKASGILIGYRGETLNSLQNILMSIANKNKEKRVRVILNIDNYKEKRKTALEELAIKVSKTVIKNNKKITLEPMNSYERKIIHAKLQDVPNIKTYSIGEDPNRRIIIEKIN